MENIFIIGQKNTKNQTLDTIKMYIKNHIKESVCYDLETLTPFYSWVFLDNPTHTTIAYFTPHYNLIVHYMNNYEVPIRMRNHSRYIHINS